MDDRNDLSQPPPSEAPPLEDAPPQKTTGPLIADEMPAHETLARLPGWYIRRGSLVRAGEQTIYLLAVIGAVAIGLGILDYFGQHQYVGAYLIAYIGFRYADDRRLLAHQKYKSPYNMRIGVKISAPHGIAQYEPRRIFVQPIIRRKLRRLQQRKKIARGAADRKFYSCAVTGVKLFTHNLIESQIRENALRSVLPVTEFSQRNAR